MFKVFTSFLPPVVLTSIISGRRQDMKLCLPQNINNLPVAGDSTTIHTRAARYGKPQCNCRKQGDSATNGDVQSPARHGMWGATGPVRSPLMAEFFTLTKRTIYATSLVCRVILLYGKLPAQGLFLMPKSSTPPLMASASDVFDPLDQKCSRLTA